MLFKNWKCVFEWVYQTPPKSQFLSQLFTCLIVSDGEKWWVYIKVIGSRYNLPHKTVVAKVVI